MSSLYAFGQDPLAFYSQSLGSVAQFDLDGVLNWTRLTKPMGSKVKLLSVATDGVRWIAVGAGGAASTVDPSAAWTSYAVEDGWCLLRKVIHNGSAFWAAGFVKNAVTLEETASVFSTQDGIDSTVWPQRYQDPNGSSGFFDIASLGGSELLAVGYTNNSEPLLVYSADGIFWQTVGAAQLEGPIYSVTYNVSTNRIWLGGQGWIATGLWAGGSTSWTVSEVAAEQNALIPISLLSHTQDQVLAAGGSTSWISTNNVDWKGVTAAGYTFESAAWFDNSWYLGCSGLLNQYTGFVLLTDGDQLRLQGYHSQVQAHSLLVI